MTSRAKPTWTSKLGRAEARRLDGLEKCDWPASGNAAGILHQNPPVFGVLRSILNDVKDDAALCAVARLKAVIEAPIGRNRVASLTRTLVGRDLDLFV